MADNVDEEVELDLELDVDINEFEEEFEHKSSTSTEYGCRQDVSNKRTTVLETKNVCGSSARETSNVRKLSKSEVKHAKSFQRSCIDEEEGELLESQDEMDLKTDTELQKSQNEISIKNTENVVQHEVDSQGTCSERKLEDDISMEVDEDGLLDSEDESQLCGEKKCIVESEESKNETRSEDQIMKTKRKTRGGIRKKKRIEQNFVLSKLHNEKKIKPIIGRLFRPLTANEDDTAEFLAHQLADRLEEEKDGLILRVVKILGHKKALEMFQETKTIQMAGGMDTKNTNRKRTSGGIFLCIMKQEGYATKEQIKEIYSEERAKERKLVKEYRERAKELEEREIQDLREILQEKREALLKLETENQPES